MKNLLRLFIAIFIAAAFLCAGSSAQLLSISGGTPSSETWSPTAKNSHAALSNGNLTATSTTGLANFQTGIAVSSFTTGAKVVFQATIGPLLTNTPGIGVANGVVAVNDGAYLGSEANGVGYYPEAGLVFINGSTVASGWTLASNGSAIVVAVDFTAGKIWFWNPVAANWNNDILANQNPATGAGGIVHGITGALFPAYCVTSDGVSTTNLTALFSTPLSISTPAGYSQLP